MNSASHIAGLLEDQSLSILSAALAEVRANGPGLLRGASDDELRLAIYPVLLGAIDFVRSQEAQPDDSRAPRRDTRSIYEAAVREMMDCIDSQSAYTAGHTRAVATHVVHMAARAGLDDDAINELETAAWVHNIGLINQSQKLATLPRTLTESELHLARNHTVVGAEMLRPVAFMAHLVPIVRFHHARFDGRGAPGQPSGDAIPFGARLICLADAFQAMLEPRAYRPALSRSEALLEIDRESGAQFDPQLVPLVHEL